MADWLSQVLAVAPPMLALAANMLLAMVSAPFMHNAPTVLVFGPIAASLAQRLHLNPDAFLVALALALALAVAVDAASDFLTPFGHQCNTLVMGPGGYNFSDYPRLGVPLSLTVLTVGTLLISVVWPMR